MLNSEYGAAEEQKRKEQEAQDFAARMNAKYNNNSTQRATDEYDRRYGNPKTETPDFQKYLQTPAERIRTGTSSFLRSAGHYIKTAAQKTSSYTKKKSAERKAYLSSPEYKQKQAEKAEARKERKENFRKRMAESKKRYQQQNGINRPTHQRQQGNQGFSLFGPSTGGFGFPQQSQTPRRKAQNNFQIGGIAGSVPSLFEAPRRRAPKAKKGRNQYRQRRPPRGGIIDSMPVIGGF
jgi:hypothetical protein